MENSSKQKICFVSFSIRGQTRKKQHRRLPADGEKPDSSSPGQSGGPAAVPRTEYHRSHAQQSERPTQHFSASICGKSWLASKSEYLPFFVCGATVWRLWNEWLWCCWNCRGSFRILVSHVHVGGTKKILTRLCGLCLRTNHSSLKCVSRNLKYAKMFYKICTTCRHGSYRLVLYKFMTVVLSSSCKIMLLNKF